MKLPNNKKMVIVDEIDDDLSIDEVVSSEIVEDSLEENETIKITKKKIKLHWYSKLLLFVDACAIFCFIMSYSDLDFAHKWQDWLVPTALGTGKHKFYAYILYNEEMVEKISKRNVMVSPSGVSDPSLIEFVDYDNIEINYENPYEREVLEKNEGNDDYKIIEFRENSYAGTIAFIYHPETLDLVAASTKYGNQVSQMTKREKALLGVNCSGFRFDSETKYMVPSTNMIIDGEIYYEVSGQQNMIGMNKDGVLMLNYCTAQEAIDMGYEWAVQFGPFLIVNGEAATFSGNGGGGYEPRTAIGQRKDGIVVLVVIDGRGMNGSIGATFGDVLNILLRYGCYNAANLDGGGSSVMVEKDTVITHPCDDYNGERVNVSALVYRDNETNK